MEAIYPGTFDPITVGHLDIIKRACNIFEEVVVAVAASKDKKPMFDSDSRLKMVHLAVKNLPKVKVKSFDTLLVDFAKKENIHIIIRGLRAVSDFEYELQLAYTNRSLDPNIDTITLMPSLEYAFISSSVVRSIIKHNGDISNLVPKDVKEYIKNVYSA
jgi:pantetheine-phosphate adenylyltransferase